MENQQWASIVVALVARAAPAPAGSHAAHRDVTMGHAATLAACRLSVTTGR
jgi:hypothetical protein